MSQGYGTDLWVGFTSSGVLDLDPSMRETSGVYVLAQSLVMAQTTGLGSLIGSPDDCYDLRAVVSKGMTVSQIQQIAGTIRNVLLRDQRVQSATVTGSFSSSTSTLTLLEQVFCGAGPFTLTLSVSNLTITAFLNGNQLGSNS